MKTKSLKIILESIPVLFMIALIPHITNDYLLTLIYTLIIGVCLFIKTEKLDSTFLILGFFIMIVSESIFISTGVEVFTRHTLLGLMPLWLPFLWSYSFVVMKRSVKIIEA